MDMMQPVGLTPTALSELQASVAKLSSLDPAVLLELQGSIARLSTLLQEAPGNRLPSGAPVPHAMPAPVDLKRLLHVRAKRRRNAFGPFLDWPAWDMLLDLAAVKAEGGHVSVSAICVSSGAPQSTALRKLAGLESAGLVERYLHDKDRRRVCLTLTDEGSKLVHSMIIEDLRLYGEWAEMALGALPPGGGGAIIQAKAPGSLKAPGSREAAPREAAKPTAR